MAYTYSELEGFWVQAGGDPNVAPIMAAVAEAESSGVDQVQKGQPYSSTGWGLWQITPGNSEPNIGVDNALLNPLTNARAAVAKYKSQGLAAWSTYTSGSYRQYFQSGVQAVYNGNAVSQASATNGSNAGNSITNNFLDTLMQGLGVSDMKDLSERLGLIVFGALLIIIGAVKFSGSEKTALKYVKSGGPVGAARKTALKTAGDSATDVEEKVSKNGSGNS